jgi:hypothetical protein
MEHRDPCAVHYIGVERSGFQRVHDSGKEAAIRNFGVGIIAIATIAFAGLFFRRRRATVPTLANPDETVDELYAAGL